MATAPLLQTISVEEYLRTPFRPDVDYVDGILEERNMGEFDHGRLQGAIYSLLVAHEQEWDVYVTPELRVQVSATRWRIPDVCVTDARREVEQIATYPPLLCVEILSPEDRLPRVLARVKDYHRMGVATAWVFDSSNQQVWVSNLNGAEQSTVGPLTVPGTSITLDPAAAFARMSRRR